MPKLVVIGSGVFGVWTALLARRAGYETSLLDARGAANNASSSSGESRILRLAYGGDELYTRFAARSLDLWKAFFEAEHCRECFQPTGALWITQAGEPAIHRVRSVFEKLAIDFEYLEGERLRKRYPQFSFALDSAAILEPASGALLAAQSVRAVLRCAEREGVKYRGESVDPPTSSHAWLPAVHTASGERIDADTFVFACGAWLPQMFTDALAACIFPTRQELFFFAPPPGDLRFQAASMPVWIDQSGSKIAYGFPDLEGAGVKVAFHELGTPIDPNAERLPIGAAARQEAARYLGERFPALRGSALVRTRICPYENTSSGDFLIDRHPRWSNVWFLGGGSGHGFKHAPAVAEYLLRALDGDHAAEPRFLLRTKERHLNRKVV